MINFMNSNLLEFKNSEFEVKIKLDENNSPTYNAEMVAKSLGIGEFKNNKYYVKWTRVNKYLSKYISTQVSKESFLAEPLVYKLAFKAGNEVAERFQDWLACDVIPQIRKTGGYIPVNEEDNDKTIMAKALKIADKTIQEKDNLILQLKPKAEMCDKFLTSKGYISMNKAAKGLKVGRNKMMEFLRSLSILFRDDHDNMPYQQYVTSGYFTVDYHNGRDGQLHAVTKVSVKGIEFIHKLYQKYQPVTERTVA